ncbi:hypothetical protein AC579_4240 [Pseudocercospora musae]|uniref:Uncharacterized protein n=1 Tax=Pseudocercospora musae TaxID=113226 RepID=A0A139IFA9_9PEZI|nr:hypothetical protein AC579_4240 [Pseudocercospora musae]
MPMETEPAHSAPPTMRTTLPSWIVRLRLYWSAVHALTRHPRIAPAELRPLRPPMMFVTIGCRERTESNKYHNEKIICVHDVAFQSEHREC